MTRHYNVILFDLDGTLIDSKAGIFKSLQYALAQFDLIEENQDNLKQFIGPPLFIGFQKYFPSDENKIHKAIEAYRDYYGKYGMAENVVYPGIPELLNRLKQNQKKLILASAKTTTFAVQSLMHAGLYQYFHRVYGSNLDGSLSVKTELIQHVLSMLPNHQLNNIVLVGDSELDIRGAHENAIDSIAVTYGYSSEEELKKTNPGFIVHSVEELQAFLLNA